MAALWYIISSILQTGVQCGEQAVRFMVKKINPSRGLRMVS
jgi:type III secretory pathway component EscU